MVIAVEAVGCSDSLVDDDDDLFIHDGYHNFLTSAA